MLPMALSPEFSRNFRLEILSAKHARKGRLQPL